MLITTADKHNKGEVINTEINNNDEKEEPNFCITRSLIF